MRFLHTADWHLGKRLHDFLLTDVQRQAVEAVIRLVADTEPDAVVVAGDVFDTQVPSLAALELWEAAVESIVGEHGVPMVVIPGNHDHADRLAVHSGLARRAGLYYVRDLAECANPVTIAGVDFHGVPFHKPVHVNAAFRDDAPGIGDFDYAAAMSHTLERVRRQRSDRPAVLIAHAFVAGAGDEPEGEDAISVGGAGAVPVSALAGFDYVALGHIHRSAQLGADSVQYSGSLYPYSFSEIRTGVEEPKSVTLVEIGPSGGVVTFEQLRVKVDRCVRVLEGMSFADVLVAAQHEAVSLREHYTLVRVTDTDPLTDAVAALREWYPHAVLEQPHIAAPSWVPRLTGDYRTTSPEDALRQFHRYVFGEDLSGLEEDVLREATRDDAAEEPDA